MYYYFFFIYKTISFDTYFNDTVPKYCYKNYIHLHIIPHKITHTKLALIKFVSHKVPMKNTYRRKKF